MASSKLIRVSVCVYFAFFNLGPVGCQRNCGRSNGPHPREGYSRVEQGAWPWMAAIVKANRAGVESYLCAGFLIDRRHVITSAHCFEGNHTTSYSTRIGDPDLTLGDQYSISRIVIHEGFKRGDLHHDIALLTLSEDVDVPHFSPVCLDSGLGNLTGAVATVVSWGASRLDDPVSVTLKQSSGLAVWPNEFCNLAYSGRFRRVLPRGITSGMICAGFLVPREGICYGSAGSPLMIQEQNRWIAIGVTSFGHLCGRPDYPDVYTKVSEYLTWINQNKNY